MTNINVSGWYGRHNVGDESYKLAFPSLFPSASFTFASTPSPTTTINVVGGGDIVTVDLLTKLAAAGGRRFLMSVTISQELKPSLYQGLEQIIVRDIPSQQYLERAGIACKRAPDFAFGLVPDAKAGREQIQRIFAAEQKELYEKVVTVVVNAHLLRNQDARQAVAFEKLSHDLAYVADWTNASFLFLPFGSAAPWDDRAANGYIGTRPKWYKKNVLVFDRYDPQSCLNIIAASDAVISTRLHSSIFAAAAGVPFVDITHNHKNSAFLQSLELTEWSVPYMTFDAERCRSLLSTFFESDAERKRIAEAGNEQRELLHRVITDVRFD